NVKKTARRHLCREQTLMARHADTPNDAISFCSSEITQRTIGTGDRLPFCDLFHIVERQHIDVIRAEHGQDRSQLCRCLGGRACTELYANHDAPSLAAKRGYRIAECIA